MNDQRYDVTFHNVPSERLAMLILAAHAKPGSGHLDRAVPEVTVLPPPVPPIHIPNGACVTVDGEDPGYTISVEARGTFRSREEVLKDLCKALEAMGA